MVYLPMGYLWAKRFSVPLNPFLQQLREVRTQHSAPVSLRRADAWPLP